MRILFLISLVAVLALLWAAYSIARHIHKAREVRRLLGTADEIASTSASTAESHKIDLAEYAAGNLPPQPTANEYDHWIQQRDGSWQYRVTSESPYDPQ